MTEQRDPRPRRTGSDDWKDRLDTRHYGDDLEDGDRPVPDDVPPHPDTDLDADAIAAELDAIDGTLVLVDGTWHHSHAFDGYQHTTACDVVLDCVDVDTVELDVPTALEADDVQESLCTTCEQALLDGGSA